MNDADMLIALNSSGNCRLANPTLFDSKMPKLAIRALDYCLDCPVTKICRDFVLAPYQGERAYFDGVAGGRVWSKGRDITASVLARADEISQKEADLIAGNSAPPARRPYKPLRWLSIEYAVLARPHSVLTSAEKIAACLVAWDIGLSSDEAATRFGMRPKTVRQYRSDAAGRLNAEDIRQAHALAERLDSEDQAA